MLVVRCRELLMLKSFEDEKEIICRSEFRKEE
jgi:hypothetical protein